MRPPSRTQNLHWDILLNENLPQPVVDLPSPQPALDAAPAKAHKELIDFQTTPVPAGSGALFTEQPMANKKRTTKRK